MVRPPRGSRPALGSAQVVQVGHQDQVLLTGEEVNNGRELAGDTNLGAHRGKIGGQFVSGDVRTLRSAVIRGGQDLHHRGLAGAVGAEQREDRPFGHGEVDPVEDDIVAVGLPESGGRNRRPGGDCGCHAGSMR
ncbi:MAG TPA: hypothetical protein VII33_00220 [Nakamurella sp.]